MNCEANSSSEPSVSSPIVVQTHAYMSPPDDQPTDGDQQSAEAGGEAVLGLLSIQPLDEEVVASEDAEAAMTDNAIPAIEHSGTSSTEGTATTEDYSNPSSPTSPSTPSRRQQDSKNSYASAANEVVVPSTPPSNIFNPDGTPSRPVATPAGPAQRTRNDNKLSMLYTPVKKGGDKIDVSNIEDEDFIENEAGAAKHHGERRKLPCNWMAWVALVVVIGGALMIATGVVVHGKKQQAADAAKAASMAQNIDNTAGLDDITNQPTFSPSSKPTDPLPPLEPALFDPLAPGSVDLVVDANDISISSDESNEEETLTEEIIPVIDTDTEDALATTPENAPEIDSYLSNTKVEPTRRPTSSAAAVNDEENETSATTTGTASPTSSRKGSNSKDDPTASPTISPTSSPPVASPASKEPVEIAPAEDTSTTTSETKITYRPGDLTVSMNGLLLSTGLEAKIIAKSGKKVMYADGKTSDTSFHKAPDFGGTFATPDGGWIYASNSEVENGKGGVGAITFDKKGRVTHYEKLLKGTTMNCGGGRTPWGTWISCEEWNLKGQVWEVDPTGRQAPRKTVLGGEGGRFESFSYDVRDKNKPTFYVTEDKFNGALRRFTPDPSVIDWDNPKKMLHGKGMIEYLVLIPSKAKNATKGEGSFTWTKHLKIGKESAMELFPNVEGIDVADGELFFVSKRFQEMTILDLSTNKYRTLSTVRGLFDGKPDQIQRITHGEGLLYFTEEGGEDAGVHARDSEGRFYTVLESPVWKDETTGLSFSPDGIHLYVAYQANGLLFDVTREDGLPFNGRSINAKFHNTELNGDKNE